MATLTQNPQAGDYLLDSFPNIDERRATMAKLQAADYSVYVPPQCAGPHRCPLLVYLNNQGEQWRLPADRYGLIVLFLGGGAEVPSDAMAQPYDAALKQTLRRFAIDPDKIAIGGTCSTGGQAFYFGRSNLQIFNRVIAISPTQHFTVTTPPQNTNAEFYLVVGIDEQTGQEGNPRDNFYLQHSMRAARELWNDGFRDERRVKAVLDLRTHEGRTMDYELVARWLHESWAQPDPTTRPAPVVVDDPLPVLTEETLTRLTDFWKRFMQEPDTIRVRARLASLRQVFVPIGGTMRRVMWMSDLAPLAARYPAVAADLRAAGLTAGQADGYRLALISARATWSAGVEARPVAPNSALERNVAFFDAHPKEIEAAAEAGIWRRR